MLKSKFWISLFISFLIVIGIHVKGYAKIIGEWRFDEGAGQLAMDSSTHGNHGTIQGAQWTMDGRVGGALLFDGIDDYVRIPHAPSLNLSEAITIEAWIYGTGSAFRATERTIPGEIPGGLPKLQILGDEIYYSFNAGIPPNVWTAVTDIDGSGWTCRQHTSDNSIDTQIVHKVVDDMIYFTWHGGGEWYGAKMNLDGTGFAEVKLSEGEHDHY